MRVDTPAIHAHSYKALRIELEQSGVLQPASSKSIFAKEYSFKSPSAAAAVIQGRPANGTVECQVAGTSKSSKEWEADNLDKM